MIYPTRSANVHTHGMPAATAHDAIIIEEFAVAAFLRVWRRYIKLVTYLLTVEFLKAC